MSELFGRETGICAGRGGSMHIADFSRGMLGANGIVAGGLGIAVGAGLAAVLRSTGDVSVSFFGDGSTNRGPFHESLNLAALWRLPVVFVCENNGWASTTRSSEASAHPDLAGRASSLGVPAVAVDGNDLFEVYDAMSNAVASARRGDGPAFLEAVTYRMRGHYVGDPTKYRTNDEVAGWSDRDPIARAAASMTARGWITAADVDESAAVAERAVDDAIEVARAAPLPDPAGLADFVYAPETQR
jgi:pyruvate dehydrogenase E1 component alpha subunit